MINFNPKPSTWLHIDLNSCFATVEQQANPLLRGKPVAVAAYTSPRGCILAPSIEAKRYGIKVGMRVMDGKRLCPKLIILPSDPPKYRFINRNLLNLMQGYTSEVFVKSIDEMLLRFDQSVIVKSPPKADDVAIPLNNVSSTLINIAHEIKSRIKAEIGDWLTVSVGISTNPYLAKLAAGLNKPDGLDEINKSNILDVLSKLKLIDLPYIKQRNAFRLFINGVTTPVEFYFASPQQLKAAFQSVAGHYWPLRLHGFSVDEIASARRSIGHSYALPKTTNDLIQLQQILYKLVEKMGRRLRRNSLTAQGIHLGMGFTNGSFWHHGHKLRQQMYTSSDLFNAAITLLNQAKPLLPVATIAVTCFGLKQDLYNQLTIFTDESRKRSLTRALDKINDKWGEFSMVPGTSLKLRYNILDRISFGSVMDMPQIWLNEVKDWQRETYLE